MTRSRWKLLRRVITFLLLGAMVNVAVAWGIAAYAPFWRSSRSQSGMMWHFRDTWREDAVDWWNRECPFANADPLKKPLRRVDSQEKDSEAAGTEGDLTAREDSISTLALIGLEYVHVSGWARDQQEFERCYGIRVACGFPAKALNAACWLGPLSDGKKQLIQGGIRVQPHSFNDAQDELSFLFNGRYLAWRPMWPGFAINTVFYAVILWLLVFASGQVQRQFRARRELCPACAYPVGTSDVCTECGQPVNHHVV